MSLQIIDLCSMLGNGPAVNWTSGVLNIAGANGVIQQWIPNADTTIINPVYPFGPTDPQPYFPPTVNIYGCLCHGCLCNHFCSKCFADAMAALAALKPKDPVPMTPNVADNLMTQAKTRIAEIQKRLDEVPALKTEIARLKRMVDAAEGK